MSHSKSNKIAPRLTGSFEEGPQFDTLISVIRTWGGTVVRELGSDYREARRSVAGWMLFQTKWTECLHGAGALREALSDLLDLTGGRVAHLTRSCGMTGRHRTIASLDRGSREGERPMTAPLGPALLTLSSAAARAGTLWTLGELDRAERDTLDDRALRWMADRRLRDAAVVPLDRAGSDLDILEIHLPAALSPTLRAELEVAATAMSAAWRRRQKGRIARLLSATPAIAERLAQEAPAARPSPLSPVNPLGLTAAELRICVLFRDGHPPHQMAQHLKLSESTLRTHLRSIYAKAGVAGQLDLVRLLLAAEPDKPPRMAG
jgi:DNA-binding CsgD family transcriptional regulator